MYKAKWRYNYRKAQKKVFIDTLEDIDPDEVFKLCKDLSKFKGIRHLYNLEELKEFKSKLGKHCVRATDSHSNVLDIISV